MKTSGKGGTTKLSKIERVEDFFLAVAGGADINERVQGRPLAVWLWGKLMQCTDIESETAQTLLKKLDILEKAGADLSACVWSDLIDLTYTAQTKFIQFERLMRYESSRRAICGSEYYRSILNDFRKALQHLEEVIDGIDAGDQSGQI